MKRTVDFSWQGILAVLFLLGLSPSAQIRSFGLPAALAQPEWRTEYEQVCSKTNVAMALSAEELRTLIARCDKLETQITAEEESTRKVYLRRLKMCRDLYTYVLENKEKK